jgi:hypothetical protein
MGDDLLPFPQSIMSVVLFDEVNYLVVGHNFFTCLIVVDNGSELDHLRMVGVLLG